jgi:hypothetical protein
VKDEVEHHVGKTSSNIHQTQCNARNYNRATTR